MVVKRHLQHQWKNINSSSVHNLNLDGQDGRRVPVLLVLKVNNNKRVKCEFSDVRTRCQKTACWNRLGDNYEAACNQGGPCQAKRSLMSQHVTPELRGCTANQTPRRVTKRMLAPALHHHAGRNAITRPDQCAVLFTSPVPPCWLLNQHARLPGKRCMEPEVARGCNQKLSHVHSNSKHVGLYQDKLEQSSKWTWQDGKWKRGRSLAFWSLPHKHGGTAWGLLCPLF